MNERRPGFSSASQTLATLITAAVCGYVLLTLPRTAIPTDMPVLWLDPAQCAEQIAKDTKDAEAAPHTPTATALEALLTEKGESERQALEPQEVTYARQARIASAVRDVRAMDGEQALGQLRARAVQRMAKALDLELPPEQVQAVLGAFPQMLLEVHASQQGVINAPELVVRTLYKVRWNVIMGLPRLYALERVELLAYHGWFGLHLTDGPTDARISELDTFGQLGGRYAREAIGVLAFQGDNPGLALRAFRAAEARRPSFRLQNLARTAELAMGAQRARNAPNGARPATAAPSQPSASPAHP